MSRKNEPDLSVTALYTAGVWAHFAVPGADALASADTRRVFGAVNGALALASLFRKLPSLPDSLLERHMLIDALLRESKLEHVLELAAGLSARGLRFTTDPSISYTEVDREPLLARKRALLSRTDVNRGALARPNWRMIAKNLDNESSLDDLHTAPPGAPLAVIAEGLLMYLDATAQRALWARIGKLFASRPGSLFLFDFVPTVEQPQPGAIGRGLSAAMRAFTRGQTFERDARTRAEIIAEMATLGLSAQPIEPRTVAALYHIPLSPRPTQQLVWRCVP